MSILGLALQVHVAYFIDGWEAEVDETRCHAATFSQLVLSAVLSDERLLLVESRVVIELSSALLPCHLALWHAERLRVQRWLLLA